MEPPNTVHALGVIVLNPVVPLRARPDADDCVVVIAVLQIEVEPQVLRLPDPKGETVLCKLELFANCGSRCETFVWRQSTPICLVKLQ